jgi:hypothetical protein
MNLSEFTFTPAASSNTAHHDKDDARCAIRSCRMKDTEKLKCAANGCNKMLHLECYESNVLAKYDLHPLPGINVACTKAHHAKATKELSGGGEDQAEGGRKGNWESDGKLGPTDPHTSMKILLDWWMAEGNYSKFCGKNNDGIKKIQFCNNLAAKITEETSTSRDGKNVLNKIQHIERTFKEAHNFAESETGAGIRENDGETTFQDLVKKKCPFYYDIYDIMIDRASTRPKATSYELDGKETDGDEDEEEDNEGDEFSSLQDILEADIRHSATAGDAEIRTIPTSIVATPARNGAERTTPGSSSSRAKRRKKSPYFDDDAVTIMDDATKRSEERMKELVRHHMIMETVETKKLELQKRNDEAKLEIEKKREEREEKLAAMDAWKGKTAELDYKMNLLNRYQEMKTKLKWTDEQIIAFFPDMEQVIRHDPNINK